MIKIAMLSFWHVHARDYARQVNEHPDTEIVAVWDENPERGQKEAAERSVPYFSTLDELFSADFDAVIVNTPTNMHADVIIRAANAGKHIFTEKVLAPTSKECHEILHAVRENGVKLIVSLPRLNDFYTHVIQDILRQGLLGELTLVRVRLSHNGATANWLPEHFYDLEACGGGALIDLGCHPMYLTRLFLGVPVSVSANYGYITGKQVEDNAVAVLIYPSGALGIVEAGFVNDYSPFCIEVHGKLGTILYGFPDNTIQLRTHAYGDDSPNEWKIIKQQSHGESTFQQWIQHIKQNTFPDENIELALDLTRLMEAANISAKQKCVIKLADLDC